MIHEFGPWIEWAGGVCPVAGRDGIQIQCRNETREQAEAAFIETGVFYMWGHRGGTGDIIAYRVVKPAPDTHRGWSISYYQPPIPIRSFDWTATGPNFDADYQGEEDGFVGNGQQVSAPTRELLITEIDHWITEHCETCGGHGLVTYAIDDCGPCPDCPPTPDRRGMAGEES